MTEKEFEILISKLNSSYSKEQLSMGWGTEAFRFYKERPEKKWNEVSASTELKAYSAKTTQSKDILLRIGFSVVRERELFLEFLSTLPSEYYILFSELIYQSSLKRQEVEKILGVNTVVKKVNSWSPTIYIRLASLFRIRENGIGLNYNWTADQLNFEVSLPIDVRIVLMEYFPKPKGYELEPVTMAPSGSESLFAIEGMVLQELPSITTFLRQGQIVYSEKGKPNSSSVKKLVKVLKIKELYPGTNWGFIRSNIITGMFYNYKYSTDTGAEMIKKLITDVFLGRPIAHYLFTQMKGGGSIYPSEHSLNPNQDIWMGFHKLPVGEWVTMENLITHFRLTFAELIPFRTWDISNKLYVELPGDGRASLTHYDKLNNYIIKPMIGGSCAIFASFGCMDLILDNSKHGGEFGKDWFSEYDGIKAIRLTDLGAYALGLRQAYIPSIQNSDFKIIPEPESLILRVDGDLSIADARLANYCVKIAESRYQFNAGLFLKDCRNAKEVKNKVSLFMLSLGNISLPPFWTNYLTKLVNNSTLVAPRPSMAVYQLKADDKLLHKLIVQDEVLKKIVIKAEQYYILVEGKNEATLKNRLKEFGILLE
jgi:hypothetical protein